MTLAVDTAASAGPPAPPPPITLAGPTVSFGPDDGALSDAVWQFEPETRVELAPGTYTGPIALPRSVSLVAAKGMGSVTLAGSHGATLSIEGGDEDAPRVQLRDLVVRGPTRGFGAAVQQYSAAQLELDGCLLTGGRGRGEGGGGVDVQAGYVALRRCRLTRNAALQGGGVRASGPVWVELESCVLAGNRAAGKGGGAVFAADGARVDLRGCTVSSAGAATVRVAAGVASVVLSAGRTGALVHLVNCLVADDVPDLPFACLDQGRVVVRHSCVPRAPARSGVDSDDTVLVRAVGVEPTGTPAWRAPFAVVLRGVGQPDALRDPRDLYGTPRGDVWVGAVG